MLSFGIKSKSKRGKVGGRRVGVSRGFLFRNVISFRRFVACRFGGYFLELYLISFEMLGFVLFLEFCFYICRWLGIFLIVF